MFSCEFCEISKNTFFTEHIWVSASESKAIRKVYSKATASHNGRDLIYSKSFERLCWYSIYKDVKSYIKPCQNCQKQGDLKPKTNGTLHSIPVSSNFMKSEGVDLCELLIYEVNGYCHLIVWIDYFSKWSEAKPTTNKTAPTIGHFLYEMMCRHGCFAI